MIAIVPTLLIVAFCAIYLVPIVALVINPDIEKGHPRGKIWTR